MISPKHTEKLVAVLSDLRRSGAEQVIFNGTHIEVCPALFPGTQTNIISGSEYSRLVGETEFPGLTFYFSGNKAMARLYKWGRNRDKALLEIDLIL